MNEQENFIARVAEAAGADIALAPDGTCDFVVDEAVISATYRAVPRDWLLVTTVLDADEDELPGESLAIVLRQSLFGAGTLGFMPGLFANAVVLSGTIAADGLAVEDFMAKCVQLAQARAKLAAHLDGLPEAPVANDGEPPEAETHDRIRV